MDGIISVTHGMAKVKDALRTEIKSVQQDKTIEFPWEDEEKVIKYDSLDILPIKSPRFVDIKMDKDFVNTEQPAGKFLDERGYRFGTLIMSKRSSRFSVPGDLNEIKNLKPESYLRKYCKLSSSRRYSYQKTFSKFRGQDDHLTMNSLKDAMQEVLVGSITAEDLDVIFSYGVIRDNTVIDFELYAAVCALAERILCPKVTINKNESKDQLETVDFEVLNLKLQEISIDSDLKKLLKVL